MFTSRAEDRLYLRHDNADQRLAPRAFQLGLLAGDRWEIFQRKMQLLDQCRALIGQTKLGGVPIAQLLKRAEFGITDLPQDICSAAPREIWDLVETEIKYSGYVQRQAQQNKEMEKNQRQGIPDGFNFDAVSGLSSEARQKLSKIRPTSLGEAARISGVTSADVSILHIWLRRNSLSTRRARPSGTAVH